MSRTYNCPKCGNRTVHFSEMSKALICSYMDWTGITYKECKFRHPMPKQAEPPNDSQIMLELGKHK